MHDSGQGESGTAALMYANSVFLAQFLTWEIEQYGVNCGVVGAARGATAVAAFLSGQPVGNAFAANMAAVGGFEALIWMQGHTDARSDTTAANYNTRLQSAINYAKSLNTVYSSPQVVIAPPSSWAGSITSDASIADTAAILLGAEQAATAIGAQVVMIGDMALYDASHPVAVGEITLARSFHRALRGDYTPPKLVSASRVGTVLTLSCSVTAPDTALVASGTPTDRIDVFKSGSTEEADRIAVSAVSVSGTTITVTLDSDPGNSQTLDVYVNQYPVPTGNDPANMIRGNAAAGLSNGLPLDQNRTAVVAAAPGGESFAVTFGTGVTVTSYHSSGSADATFGAETITLNS